MGDEVLRLAVMVEGGAGDLACPRRPQAAVGEEAVGLAYSRESWREV